MPSAIVRRWVHRLMSGLIVLALCGCAATLVREAVPERLASEAQLSGMVNVRFWGDRAEGPMQQFVAAELPRIRSRFAVMPANQMPKDDILALSGGADDGAFGAGLLAGWTRHGSRPTFGVVTGVSAGALIAPFAFLGPEYDRQLEAIFKSYGGEDIYRTNVLSGLLGGSALADSAPLAGLIARYVDARIVARLAQERSKGRYLFIGTTNLDAQRPVLWDLGKIAMSGRPEALDLIRKLMLASASIPGLFPPVTIRVMAGRRSFDEMHVDGGPTREVFFAPTDFSFLELDRKLGRKVQRRLWVVRNGKLEPEYSSTEPGALAISQRSIETLTKYQSIGDLNRIYHNAQTEGIDFNLIAIPQGFSAPRPQPFDRGYMSALFDKGFELGKAGAHWTKAPPGIVVAKR